MDANSTSICPFGECALSAVIVGLHQIDMTDAKCLRQFVKRDNSWISPSTLETAQVLLAEPGTSFDLLLRQAARSTQASKVAPDQLAHIHAQLVAVYTL